MPGRTDEKWKTLIASKKKILGGNEKGGKRHFFEI